MVIVTSPVNSVDSQRLLHEFRSFSYTKVLVIDITGSIFSRRNHFSGYLATKEELDFVVEHWSENNFYSTSRADPVTPYDNANDEHDGQHQQAQDHNRDKRSSSSVVEEDQPLEILQRGWAEKEQNERKGREKDTEGVKEGGARAKDESSSNRRKTKSTTQPGTDQKVVIVDPKPQNFLILTVFTDKLKTLHDRALHVEFEQHSKRSQSGVMEPFRGNRPGEVVENEKEKERDRDGAISRSSGSSSSSSGRNENGEDPYQLHQRKTKQMKRSEEIIVTVNGTRNCNATSSTGGAANPDTVIAGDKHKTATATSLKTSKATRAGNGPKREDVDCVENKRKDDDDGQKEANQGNGDDERALLVISKLPIFTSLTSSINESIQLLLVYATQRNCSLTSSSSSSSSGGHHARDAPLAAVVECVSALKCAMVTDRNEQLFCNYLCRTVVNYKHPSSLVGVVGEGSEPKTNLPTIDTAAAFSSSRMEDSPRLSTVSEVVAAVERVCSSVVAAEALELSLRNESSGGAGAEVGVGVAIQMQFSENLLYFYNENVVSKNNELVKRHKSEPMPNQKQQPHYPAKDYSFPNPHRLLKRNAAAAAAPSVASSSLAKDTRHQKARYGHDNGSSSSSGTMVDKRLYASATVASSDEPDMKVTLASVAAAAAENGHHDHDHLHRSNESATAASHYAKYSEYFSLFDYIVATTAAAAGSASWTASSSSVAVQVDFIILDFQSVTSNTTTTSTPHDDVHNVTELGWRPFLIMQQSRQNPQVYTTHSILPGYNDWTLIPTQNFMECGLLCIGVIALALAILGSIFVGGFVSAITIR